MAQNEMELDQERFSCSICLELLKDPVTLPCGHSYCRNCVEKHWEGEDGERKVSSCPQCRKRFNLRPVLVKNTMLADLVEQLKKSRLQADPADRCYTGAEDVACDSCSGKKLKAVKSCLQCLASYCEEHLQPHYESPTFKKHKLEEPSRRLQENVCSRHNEVMKMFCRSDQKIICYLCSMDEHKDHDMVPAAAERADRQRELEGSRQNIQQKIQEREKDLKLLQQEVKAMRRSADKTVEDSQMVFTQMIHLLEKKRRDVEQQVRSKQETELRRVKKLEEMLEQEIRELKSKDAELKKLSDTEDHNQFLQKYPSLSGFTGPPGSFGLDICPLRHFEDVTAAVAELRDQLLEFLKVTQTKISESMTCPQTRADFLKYSCELTLGPDMATKGLWLSEGNRRATVSLSIFFFRALEPYCLQVLSSQSLSGRCYWEVEWKGTGASVAVTYNNIRQPVPSDEFKIGLDDRSWALRCDQTSYSFWHNGVQTVVLGPVSSRVGVFLDHSGGVLAFYSVSQTMTLIHRVQTRFTQPLYVGLELCGKNKDTVEFCQLKQ